jgi:hypothetical protein
VPVLGGGRKGQHGASVLFLGPDDLPRNHEFGETPTPLPMSTVPVLREVLEHGGGLRGAGAGGVGHRLEPTNPEVPRPAHTRGDRQPALRTRTPVVSQNPTEHGWRPPVVSDNRVKVPPIPTIVSKPSLGTCPPVVSEALSGAPSIST